ncbi:SRPBCC family protein [Alkalicoccus luteus]|uniref:SRPBCC family protein n=1 Tax=Alkalicoccus luteus TaxID=1237094 RepID=UPI004033FC09
MSSGTFYYGTIIDKPLQEVWDFFQATENLAAITTFPEITVKGSERSEEGAEIELQMNFYAAKLSWKSRISEVSEPNYFIDEGIEVPFPFKVWRHVHAFKTEPDGRTKMIDMVQFDASVPSAAVKLMLFGMFSDRKRKLNSLLGPVE